MQNATEFILTMIVCGLFCGICCTLLAIWYSMFPNRTKKFVHRLILRFKQWRLKKVKKQFDKLGKGPLGSLSNSDAKKLGRTAAIIGELEDDLQEWSSIHLESGKD